MCITNEIKVIDNCNSYVSCCLKYSNPMSCGDFLKRTRLARICLYLFAVTCFVVTEMLFKNTGETHTLVCKNT